MKSNIPGRPFTDILGEIESGNMLHDLTEATYNMTAAVVDTRKRGKLKLEIDFLPTGKGTVAISAKLVSKEPEHDRPSTTFFVANDLSLHRDDPNQERLPLREVSISTNLKTVGE